MGEASDLFRGGFSFNKMAEAQDLYAGATSFFRSFKHRGEQQAPGLGADEDNAMYEQEHKMVTMFSGCRDDQTSADASINGMSEGAMSWAFLETMKRCQGVTYLQVSRRRVSFVRISICFTVGESKINNFIKALQDTRYILRQSNYTQIPQLSVGLQMDLNRPLCL